jgi:glycosyltransferase involved in cell wall biosynthesis
MVERLLARIVALPHGLLYDPLNTGDLAEKILQLADNKNSAEEYGRAGFEKLQTFMNNEQIIEKMVEIYQAVHDHHTP